MFANNKDTDQGPHDLISAFAIDNLERKVVKLAPANTVQSLYIKPHYNMNLDITHHVATPNFLVGMAMK